MHNTGMNTTAESAPQNKAWGPYQLRPNPLAILRLAFSTAGAISTALLIPDFFSLLPSATDVISLLMRAAGLWAYAYVLWATGFLCILHLARILGSAVLLDQEGIKLGRFEKKIPWSSIQAVNIVERKIFSKLFFIPAFQLTIHFQKPNGKHATKQLASFQFSTAEFFSLFYFISVHSTGAKPRSLDAFVFKDIGNQDLRKLAEEGRLKRALLTVLIACGLFSLLGRKAAVNYEFNTGNKEFAAARYDKAILCYSMASAIDFTFAPAWDRLARCEFRLGDLDSAEEHWKEALKMKPDMVESKLGLSMIYMLQGKLDEAEMQIEKAARLAPYDEAAYLNRAKLNALTGKNITAIQMLENFIRQKRGKEQAIGLLAEAYLREGEIQKAEKLLNSNPEILNNPYSRPFCKMVLAEVELAKGNADAASKQLRSIKSIMNSQPELLLNNALVEIAKGDLTTANHHIAMAEKINSSSPWLQLAKARLIARAESMKAGSGKGFYKENFDQLIDRARQNKFNDPCVLSALALILEEQNKHSAAAKAAQQCLELDPSNAMAKRIVDKMGTREGSSLD